MKKNFGYTLIEVMVALTIFALLAAITSSTLYHSFNIRERVNTQANQLNTLQISLTLLSRDTAQIIERAVIGEEMHLFPPFVGQPKYVEFTRGGIMNPNGVARKNTLKRIAYVCTKNELLRRSWEHLDSPSRRKYRDKIILSNLKNCSFAYLGHDHNILKEWRAYAIQQNQKKETLPLAIQFSFTISEWGSTSLLFSIPEALYAAS
jgi:general secretion pathway protein J